MIRRYVATLRLFNRNARLYLVSLVLSGLAFGVYGLLFNFYVLSLGHDEVLLGQLLSVGSATALLGALPAGYLSDRLGRKRALLAAGAATALGVAGMIAWPTATTLYSMAAVMGLGQSLAVVTLGPFMMENSGEEERIYLFSFGYGAQMLAAVVGYWLGGRLPRWLAAVSSEREGYILAMTLVVGMGLLALLPLLFLRTAPAAPRGAQDPWAPFRYAAQHPALLGRLLSPILVTGLGAGLFVPFMNLFFRARFALDDATIGTLLAAASLVMGLGLVAAPPLVDRFDRMRVVVLTQALSIPFLLLLGFAPWLWLTVAAYLTRVILMNMSQPVYEAFVMEQVEARARATVASLLSMAWGVGWVISPAISGRVQVAYGFGPVFLSVIALYVLAVSLYWYFFLARGPQLAAAQ